MPPLTRPEQHGPVEPRGLGGAPCPLAQPLRHSPARPTAEPSLRAGSARWSAVRAGVAVRGGDVAARPKPRRRSDYLRGRSAGSGGAAAGEGQGARAGHPFQGAGSAPVDVGREDARLRGSRVKATTRDADFQPLSPTYSSPFPWPLASLNATSRCGSLKCYPWDRVPAPPINSGVTDPMI